MEMTVADIVQPLVHATLGDGVAIRVRCWDGSEVGPADASLLLRIENRRALRRLLWSPNELGFARAYVSGDIQIEGDVFAGLDEIARAAVPEQGPGVVVDAATKRALVKAALTLGLIGLPPRSRTTTTWATTSTGSCSASR
jgi:cyclopropane-fatty-acyl-phospholipid synthase